MPEGDPFWSLPADEVLRRLGTSAKGLHAAEAFRRFSRQRPPTRRPRQTRALALFLRQFTTPIVLLLLAAALLSFFLGDRADALIILVIVGLSGFLGFWQEWGASDAMARLLATVRITATVLRDGQGTDVPVEEIVPGDVVILNAGDVIPGDALVLECKDLSADEAALTGETFPVEKSAGTVAADTPLARRTNALFKGTHVVSGTATAVVVHTGMATEFGQISARLAASPPETEFERGVRRFGQLLMTTTGLLVVAIFGINVYLHRTVLESFLFALALAVGLTPQLLPAIISVNLAHGARRMARQKVIVKRLEAIENFGSMDVLCTDKTGTLTEGSMQLHAALDAQGQPSEQAHLYAYLNAASQTGFTNPIDAAILASRRFDLSRYTKLDEVPYDFDRKRISVLVTGDGMRRLVSKGAVPELLARCTQVEMSPGEITELDPLRQTVQERYEALSTQGFRVLGVAVRDVAGTRISAEDERELTFVGFLALGDPLKPGIAQTMQELRAMGVSLKVVTGDNRFVARAVATEVGLGQAEILIGTELAEIGDDALLRRVDAVTVFAEIEPNQKERIIMALKQSGHVVGYMGDGINDAPPLHTADVSISVEGAVDVAKEAADIVLLEKDLAVLGRGIREGRVTFANTLKYMFMATSANFGNMFSMAGASLFLPFLPLLPTQILLVNLLTDLPEMAIATDTVDPELVDRPRRWDIAFIRNFMVTFGVISSVFDFLTFGVLLIVLHAGMREFRTGWFLESVISASFVVLIVRSRRPFYRSRPARALVAATVLVAVVTLLLPWNRLGVTFGFTPVPGFYLGAMAAIIALYVLAAESAKRLFYRTVQL